MLLDSNSITVNSFSDLILARRLLKSDNGRIVGGTEVDIKDYNYMAYIVMFNGSDNFECGGSIISHDYVMTAAHCLEE